MTTLLDDSLATKSFPQQFRFIEPVTPSTLLLPPRRYSTASIDNLDRNRNQTSIPDTSSIPGTTYALPDGKISYINASPPGSPKDHASDTDIETSSSHLQTWLKWRASIVTPSQGCFSSHLQVPSKKRKQQDDSFIAITAYHFVNTAKAPHLTKEELSFLDQQGCFVIPVRSILDEFLRQYFLHVHPSLPMFDEGDFWSMYHNFNNMLDPVSLFLLQAMLFASSVVSFLAFSPRKRG